MPNTRTSDEVSAHPLDGTELVRIVQAGSNAKATSQDIANLFAATARDYGWIADGTTDTGASIVNMAAALGYVVIPAGNSRISTSITVVGLMVFLPGAYLTIDTGITVTIDGLVQSPRQYIFQGAGTIVFGGSTSTNTYSEAREAQAEWFGVNAGSTSDQTPYLQAAVNAMSNLREGIIYLPMGTLNVQTTLYLNRGVKLIGKGSRRTVFSMTPDGVTGMQTAGTAGWIEGIQFEAPGGTYKNGGPCIDLLHRDWTVVDVNPGSCTQGIRLGAQNCKALNITNVVQPTTLVAGSYVVDVRAVDCLVDGVSAISGSSSQYLESIVRVETNGTGISRVTVKDVDTTVVGAIAVNVVAVNDNMAQITTEGIQQGGTNGKGVVVTNSGTAAVQGVIARTVQVAANAALAVGVYNTGAGSTSIALIDGVSAAGGATAGIAISQTAGTIPKVKIGVCDVVGATTPISITGTVGDLRIDPLTQQVRRNIVGAFQPPAIAVNGVYSIATGVSLFGSIVMVTVNNADGGIFIMRAASSPTVTAFYGTTPSSNMAMTTGALTGTTGANGKFTVSADASGTLWFENRLAGPATVQIIPMTGIQSPSL